MVGNGQGERNAKPVENLLRLSGWFVGLGHSVGGHGAIAGRYQQARPHEKRRAEAEKAGVDAEISVVLHNVACS
jgi:hypothetical protein